MILQILLSFEQSICSIVKSTGNRREVPAERRRFSVLAGGTNAEQRSRYRL